MDARWMLQIYKKNNLEEMLRAQNLEDGIYVINNLLKKRNMFLYANKL